MIISKKHLKKTKVKLLKKQTVFIKQNKNLLNKNSLRKI
jgi:hypothetical protein